MNLAFLRLECFLCLVHVIAGEPDRLVVANHALDWFPIDARRKRKRIGVEDVFRRNVGKRNVRSIRDSPNRLFQSLAVLTDGIKRTVCGIQIIGVNSLV